MVKLQQSTSTPHLSHTRCEGLWCKYGARPNCRTATPRTHHTTTTKMDHQPIKNLNQNLSPSPFSMHAILQRSTTRVGTTPAVAMHSALRKLVRPIHGPILNQSAMQLATVSQKCLYSRQTRLSTPPQRPTKPNQLTARS